MKSALRLLLTLFTILCGTTISSASIQELHEGVGFEKSHGLEVETRFHAEFFAPKRTVRTNFNQYETLAEVPISGTTRGSHRASANRNFGRQLEGSPELQTRFNDLLGTDVLRHMNSGKGKAFVNPPGAVWHHPVDNSGVMQLLRTGEHTSPALQRVLHPGPNGTGGFGKHFGGGN